MSWDGNGLAASPAQDAAGTNEFRVVLQWMVIKGGDETESAGVDGPCGGTAKGAGGTSFSQSITLEGARWLSSAPLPSLAQLQPDLALCILMAPSTP